MPYWDETMENLMVSQIQVLFLRFHNMMVDAITTTSSTKVPSIVFNEAQELVEPNSLTKVERWYCVIGGVFSESKLIKL